MKVISLFLLIILKVCLCCNNSKEISFIKPFKNGKYIQSKLGEDLTIICCHPDGAKNLIWRDKDNELITTTNNNGLFTLMDEKNRLILRIDNLDATKLGEYKCINTVTAIIKSITISSMQSNFQPKINKVVLNFPNNKPIILECLLNSNQILTSWRFNRGNKDVIVKKAGKGKGYEISKDKKIFKVIPDGKHEDIKTVWCQYQDVAINGDINTGLNEYTWNQYSPIDLKLVSDHKGPIFESNTVTLTCSFNYDEMLSVAFPSNLNMKKNMILNNEYLSKGKVILTIKDITKEFEGEYECKITKFLSVQPFVVVEETAKVKVNVIIPPVIIDNTFVTSSAKLKEDVYLKCQVKGKDLIKEDVYFEHFNPDSSSWSKLSSNRKYESNLTTNYVNILTLRIKNVTWEDRGKYRCVARNVAGEDVKIGQVKVEKEPELVSSATLVHMATKPVQITCSLSGYPLSLTNEMVELKFLTKTSSFEINVIDKQQDDLNGLSVTFEVVFKGRMNERSSYKLECFYKNSRTNVIKQKGIELQFAQKPNIPEVEVVCSGSSGIVLKYKIIASNDQTNRITRHVLSYAPSEEFDSLNKKPSNVILTKENEKNEYMMYVLKDLMAYRNYTFKWESYNMYSLSNERILKFRTKNIMPPNTPQNMHFYTKDNLVNVNVSWYDECPYSGSNSAIRDIVVNLKPVKNEDGKNSNWQWTEKNFTLDTETSSAQFSISLNNPQIDYEIEVSLRSPQGTSAPLVGRYRADVVLAGSLFSCFPRCAGSIFFLPLGFVTLLSILILLTYYY